MKYVACYCRVSTEEQVKYGFSIQAQKEALEKYCKENNYKYEFYIDEGISASSMKKRNALNNMLNKCNAFDMILFTKLDRLSRNVLDANNINKTLTENNCTMKAIDEDDIDTSTADGTFMFNLKVSLAQREIGKTSERIKFVFKNKRERGEVTSGTKKYGYDIVDKRYKVNKTEAQNIIDLYKIFVNTNGNPQKTYVFFIEKFHKGYDAMIAYLKDSSYIGKYKLYKKDIYIDNYIPRILSDDLFYSVQRLFKKKGNISKSDKPALFAGILYCSCCSHKLCVKIDNRTKKQIIRYCCDDAYRYKTNSLDRKCLNNVTIREDFVEDFLLKNLQIEAEKYIIQNQVRQKEEYKTENNSIKINSLKRKIDKLKDLYLDDLIDKETYKKDYEKIKEEIKKLSNVKTKTIARDFSELQKIINSDITSIYNNLNRENKRKFWLSIIDKIIVNKGKVEEIIFL